MTDAPTVRLSEPDRRLIVDCVVALIDATTLLTCLGTGDSAERFSRLRLGLADRLLAGGPPPAEEEGPEAGDATTRQHAPLAADLTRLRAETAALRQELRR